jgi:hypothetical protein
LPVVTPVPSTGQAPLSSAYRPGNEYSDLEKAGYTEREFFISGVAPAITSTGATLFELPYISRILVRYPTDSAKFNGTAIIEPFSWLGERGTSWVLSKRYMLRKGYAYVGYTLSVSKPKIDPKTADWPPASVPANLNLDYMRSFDYSRYALLAMYFDPARFRRGSRADPFAPQAQGIGAQLVQVVHPDLRLDGPTVDVYPFVMIYSQSELMLDVLNGIPAPPDSEHPRMRYYELAGVPHTNNNDTGTDETNDLDPGKQHEIACQLLYDDEPQEVLAQALLDGLDRWVREGTAMPRAPRVLRRGKTLVRDPQTHNVVGGVRPPWVAAPAAAYMTDPETGCGESYDTKIPYSAAQLRAMYGNYDDYLRQFTAAKVASIKEGYLLPEDAERVQPIARPGDFTSDGAGSRLR